MKLKLTLITALMLLASFVEAATVSKSFTAVGAGADYLRVRHGDKFSYDVSGTFVGTVILESSDNNGATWKQVDTSTAADAGTIDVEGATAGSAIHYRYRCSAFTSGTIVTAIADATADVPQEKKLYNRFGDAVGGITEGGLQADALELSGTLGVTGVVSLPNGTVSLPSLTFTSDPDLGLYRVGANGLGLAATTVTIPGALVVQTAGSNILGTQTTPFLIKSITGNSNGLRLYSNTGTDVSSVLNGYNAALELGANNTVYVSIAGSGAVSSVGTITSQTAGSVMTGNQTTPFFVKSVYNNGNGLRLYSDTGTDVASVVNGYNAALQLGANNTVYQTISGAGVITLGASAGGQVLAIHGATTAVGAATATMTNAPAGASGNPDIWMRINYNGTEYVFPGWTP